MWAAVNFSVEKMKPGQPGSFLGLSFDKNQEFSKSSFFPVSNWREMFSKLSKIVQYRRHVSCFRDIETFSQVLKLCAFASDEPSFPLPRSAQSSLSADIYVDVSSLLFHLRHVRANLSF